MNRNRATGNAEVDLNREAEPATEPLHKVLLDIAEDARTLKNRYPKETLVPGGGE